MPIYLGGQPRAVGAEKNPQNSPSLQRFEMTKVKGINHLGQLADYEDPDGVFGIVTEIRDRWPDLRVVYLDPDQAPDLTDTPYKILDNQDRIVLGVWKMDQRVIEQLSLRDKSAAELLALFDKEEAKAAKVREDARTEVREEVKDKVKHVFSSPKGTYTVPNQDGKIVRISDS